MSACHFNNQKASCEVAYKTYSAMEKKKEFLVSGFEQSGLAEYLLSA